MKRLHFLISVCFILASAIPCHADEITLKNGDRISGTIVKKEGESVIIKTTYAGDISINWRELNTLYSDADMQFVLVDGTSINGKAIQSQSGSIEIKSGEIVEPLSISLSQITTINPPAIDSNPVKFSGHVNAGLSITDGNTNSKNIHIDIESVSRTISNRYTIGVVHNKAETEGVDSEDNLTGYMKYDHFFTSKWYAFTNAIFIKDKFKDLNLKTAIGFGAGYQLWETPEKNLSFELGLNYVNEDYIQADDNAYPAGRWALNYDKFLFKKATQLFHKHEVLLGLEQVDDVSILTQTGLRFPLIERLNATFQVNWDWDNTPAPGTKRADTDYLATIGYSW